MDIRKNYQVYLDNEGNGFALGSFAQVVPHQFVKAYQNNQLKAYKTRNFERVIDRTRQPDLINKKPAHARVTPAGTLILE